MTELSRRTLLTGARPRSRLPQRLCPHALPRRRPASRPPAFYRYKVGFV